MHHGRRTDPGRPAPRDAAELELEDDDLEPTRLDWQLDGLASDEQVTEPTTRFDDPSRFLAPEPPTEDTGDAATIWGAGFEHGGELGWKDGLDASMAPEHDLVRPRVGPEETFGADLVWDEETGELEGLAETAPESPTRSRGSASSPDLASQRSGFRPLASRDASTVEVPARPAPLRIGTLRPMDDIPEVRSPSPWSAGVELPNVRARPKRPAEREGIPANTSAPSRARAASGVAASMVTSGAWISRSHSAPSRISTVGAEVVHEAEARRRVVRMWLVALTLGCLTGTIALCAGSIALL